MAQGEPAGPAAAPVKVSFSMPKVSHRRPPLPPKAPSADVVEYVTSVDVEAGVVVANPRAVRGARVVPKQENSWRPEKRMKNIMMEADATKSTDETFEMETMDAGPKPNVTYGLTVMSRTEGDNVEVVARRMSLKELEDQKLKEDLMNLPEEATLERYEELPVEEFGEALLRGMGWEKGKPIGRNAKIVVEPIEYVRRQGTLGLGAVSAPAPPKEVHKKYIKPGESRPKRPDLGNSQGRHSSRAEESRGKSSSENLREDERHLRRSHSHHEEKDGRYSERSHSHHEEKDERYSKRSRRHRDEEGEDERSSKRGHRHSEGDDRGERRGHKDRSHRR